MPRAVLPAVIPAKAGYHENIENNPMHSSGMIDTYETVVDHDPPYGPFLYVIIRSLRRRGRILARPGESPACLDDPRGAR